MATAEKETVRVIVRCRPFSEKEKIAGHSNIISIDSSKGTVAIADPKAPAGAPNDVPKSFTFDHAFDWNCKQTDVYNLTARPIVESVLNGYNGTIFAYGQTGTGKTFSMEGIRTVPELRGILPNSFEHIFAHIGAADSSARYLVRASYLEIYNEEIRDLLAKETKKLDIKERADTGVYVKDLSSFVVKDVEEMDKLMTAGNKNRSVGFTEMNAQSSRSHSIFTITVEASEQDTSGSGEERIRMGKLHLVDLAGSERQAKTQASGDRLKEAAKINLSLSALGNVISALVDGKSAHIPYRDSKLTRLLQDSLGGNARTLMIATLSPASYNYDETVGTLRYANRTKNIKNKPKINEDPKDAMLREYQEEIKRLKAQLEGAEGTGAQEEEEEEESEDEEEVEEEEQAKSKIISSPSKSTAPAAIPKAPQKVKKAKKEKVSKPKAVIHAPPVSDEQLKEMEASVEREKTTILTSKDMLEEERKAILIQLDLRSKEIALERDERTALAAKLEQMQAKLLVGGVNVLDQHTQQEQELAKAQAELEETRRKELELQRELEEREEQQLQIEESYSSLQEEAAVKTRKLKRLWNMLMEQKVEIKDLQTEHQREREDLLETVRELTRELRLKMLVISAFIPKEEQSIVEMSAEYDEAADKVRIAHIAHAGNNIRGKQQQGFGGNHTAPGGMVGTEESSGASDICWDPAMAFPDVYLSYETATGVSPTSSGVALGPSSARKKQSTRQAGSRPDAAAPREQRRSRPPSSVSRATKETSMKAGRAEEEAQSNTPKARGLVSKGKHYA